MKITKTKKYTLIKPSSEVFSEFLKKLNLEENSLKNEHLIIDISEIFNIDSINLNVFLPISKQHKQNGTSFVIIFKETFEEDLLDEMDIVPTFTEALDIIEMDTISRDLGF
ncbi:hypothetical protein [Lutibacter sp.]|uniref:hypothetical protein n=1 Tax=Lutibacter sp. TaxID=1925666 RepID=UPI0025C37A93|nr:hypothetical protein [Lutibacter sp.]MCF6180870.1 hypothetical protein [Lutibacter sp.]